ncbi:MAG: two pore domain potassium channel family protein [Alistipes sp.]|nr:two pore domain potassium channel family protein [Alistipes sp.]
MFLRAINILTLLASVLLLASLSVEIIYSRELAPFSALYQQVMFVICIIFIVDFFALMFSSEHRWRFLCRNFVVLVLSVPYHTIATWAGLQLGHTTSMILSGVVMLRSIMALYITLRWLIVRRATRLLWAYIATVTLCTYLAALLFYEYEAPVNSSVVGFSDALWWAGMNLTTVGAEIFPVTAIGKLICVMLPVLGTAIFPVLTVYITSLYGRYSHSGTGVVDDSDKPKNNS